MKNLIFINGTMGVGKTTTSKKLLKLLPNCVFLDGDWCWYADPWTVTDETKIMSKRNMSFLLDSFLTCTSYENVIFCWVMPDEGMINEILSMIKNTDYNLYKFSLICSEDALIKRIQKEIDNGMRENVTLERVMWERIMTRMQKIGEMDAIKIDVSNITPDQAARAIYNTIYLTF